MKKWIIALGLALGLMTACSTKMDNGQQPQSAQQSSVATKKVASTTSGQDHSSQNNSEESSNMIQAEMKTSMGTIIVELDAGKAPNTVANFKSYIESGFYDGLVFHRVIPDFMIQGGGMSPDMQEKKDKHPPIKNEANNGLKNDRGTLAMARTSDPHSASSQFFINLKDNDFLNFKEESQRGWGYAVFGRVLEGMDVVDRIAAVKTGANGFHQDVPVEPVLIESFKIVE